jgi:protein-tyrosine phosphatase
MPTSILFVCLGNICRSPMADALAAHRIRQRGLPARVDSAGTAAYHVGNPADRRTLAVLAKHGIPYDGRARRVADVDFATFDLVLAMDQANLDDLRRRCPAAHAHKLRLVLEPLGAGREVDDPYYGGPDGFDRCFAELDAALDHWLTRTT